MEKLEALTLESEREDSTHDHGSFFLEKPQEPCSHSAPLELATLCATLRSSFVKCLGGWL
jgi:hypothetical protein